MIGGPFFATYVYLWVGVFHLVFLVIAMTFMDGLDEFGFTPAPIDILITVIGWPILWWKAFHR